MGNNSKKISKRSLRDKDLSKLMDHFGLDKDTVIIILNHFENQDDLEMNKAEFYDLYLKVKQSDGDNDGLKTICDRIFETFDADDSGTVSFHEFLLGYRLTTSGDLKTKIQLTFDLYDMDKNGYLDKEEVKTTAKALMKMLGSETEDLDEMAEMQFLLLDTNKDGLISQEEFVEGLTKNYNLRLLMSPFN